MMKENIAENTAAGHLAAVLTIFIWGTTFISTKVLLTAFQPVEILLYRFIIGFAVLFIACPKLLRTKNFKEELLFIGAGFCGICWYYLLENIALTYTMASNVGVIVAASPFFTAILGHFLMKDEHGLHLNFVLGFIISMVGISLISFNGSHLQLNPAGDLLALAAAGVWAFYSVLTRKISDLGYPTLAVTRRTFFYGILFMIPAWFIFGGTFDLTAFAQPKYLFNILFLGLAASALCFATWNFAVRVLGAVKTSVYIYMIPVITVVTSALVLHERITLLAGVGTVLTLLGLLLSERRKLKLLHK